MTGPSTPPGVTDLFYYYHIAPNGAFLLLSISVLLLFRPSGAFLILPFSFIILSLKG
jgi:hypothetical protein